LPNRTGGLFYVGTGSFNEFLPLIECSIAESFIVLLVLLRCASSIASINFCSGKNCGVELAELGAVSTGFFKFQL